MPELNLKEAIDHAKLIKKLNCKVCGKNMSIENNLIELVAAIRNNGYCTPCHYIHYYRLTHNGQYPNANEMYK